MLSRRCRRAALRRFNVMPHHRRLQPPNYGNYGNYGNEYDQPQHGADRCVAAGGGAAGACRRTWASCFSKAAHWPSKEDARTSCSCACARAYSSACRDRLAWASTRSSRLTWAWACARSLSALASAAASWRCSCTHSCSSSRIWFCAWLSSEAAVSSWARAARRPPERLHQPGAERRPTGPARTAHRASQPPAAGAVVRRGPQSKASSLSGRSYSCRQCALTVVRGSLWPTAACTVRTAGLGWSRSSSQDWPTMCTMSRTHTASLLRLMKARRRSLLTSC